MAEKAIPWWRKAIQIALVGLRTGFGLFSRPAKLEPVTETMISSSIRENREEERTLTEPSTKIAAAPMIPDGPISAAEPVQVTEKGLDASNRAEEPVSVVEDVAEIEIAQEAVPEPMDATEAEPVSEPVDVPGVAETPKAEIVQEADSEPMEVAEAEPVSEPVVVPEVAETSETEAVQEAVPEPM